MQSPPKRKYGSGRNQPNNTLAYMRLAVAIVEQACKDARGYYNSTSDKVKELMERRREAQIAEVKNFFLDESGIFPLCMPNTDGARFYKQLMENYEKYDYYIPPNIAEKRGGIII